MDGSIDSTNVLVCRVRTGDTDSASKAYFLLCTSRNIGFPSTQDVVAINEEAERQKEAKRAEMRREAEKKDGKYRRVAD